MAEEAKQERSNVSLVVGGLIVVAAVAGGAYWALYMRSPLCTNTASITAELMFDMAASESGWMTSGPDPHMIFRVPDERKKICVVVRADVTNEFVTLFLPEEAASDDVFDRTRVKAARIEDGKAVLELPDYTAGRTVRLDPVNDGTSSVDISEIAVGTK